MTEAEKSGIEPLKTQQLSFFDGDRTTQSEAIAITTEYLKDYFGRYNYVAIAYSGGKDSSATVSLISGVFCKLINQLNMNLLVRLAFN